MKKKKVLFVIESMIAGGAERVLYNLVNNLPHNEYDITLLSIFKNSVYPHYSCSLENELNSNINYKYLIDNSIKWKYRLFYRCFNRLNKRWIYSFFIKEKYDIEIAFYEGLPTIFLSYSTNKKSKKIAWLHVSADQSLRNFSHNEIIKLQKIYKRFNLIVGVSKLVEQSFREKIGIDLPTDVRYNIIDESLIREKANIIKIKRPNKFPLFVSVGRLTNQKGYDRLLKIVNQLINENFKFNLWIIGDGECKNELSKYIISNKLEEYIYLWGHQKQPYPFVKSADWFICSSRAEGYSTVITESYIIGTPVISTRCAGTEELIKNNINGIIVENTDKDLYQGLKYILNNFDITTKYKENAIKRGESFSKSSLITSIKEIL